MDNQKTRKVLFYSDEQYIGKTSQIIAYLSPDIEYCACSQKDRVFADAIVFHSEEEYFNFLHGIEFNYIVVATDDIASDGKRIREALGLSECEIIDLTLASEMLDTYEGRIQFLIKHLEFSTPSLPPELKKESKESSEGAPMHIVMSFNSKFLKPACETIYSLFKHNHNIVLHVLYIDLKDSERNAIEKFCLMDGQYEIVWHLIEDDMLDKIHFDPGRFSVYTLYRFYAYQILDESIDRCLWLDADLMIRGDIRELYDTEMGDEWYFTSALESSAYKKNPIGENIEYTNIGTLLMNLKKIRSDEMIDKFWEFLFSPDFDYPTLEQDALNIVFRGKIKFVEQGIWNSFPISEFNENVSMDTIRDYADRAKIVHFLSGKKVWLDEYKQYWEEASANIPYTAIMYDEYKQYLNESIEYLEKNG